MNKHLILSVTLFSLTGASAAGAQSAPKFQGDAIATINSAGEAVVTFKETGLGNSPATYCLGSGAAPCTAGAVNGTVPAPITATATFNCVTKNGSCPSAANKKTVTSNLNALATFSPNKNGAVSASLKLTPPTPGAFSCPGGQSLEIVEVSYSGLNLADIANKVVAKVTPVNLPTTKLYNCP